MTQAYPLAWPQGFPRTKYPGSSQFKTTLYQALENVKGELRRFGKDSSKSTSDLVISANVTLADQRPRDQGIAVYFRWDGIDCCIAVDRYAKCEDNLQAIAKVIEAQRTILRHGGLNIVRASFRGFAALPPPKGPDGQLAKPWWQILGFDTEPPLTAAEARYRELVKLKHPDRGGDAAEFNLIVDAMRQAREALKHA